MDKRKEKILGAVVREYTNTAEPVSSNQLFQKYDFECGPATLRNEMLFLEKEGYLAQPHTSAGRIPTDAGYRYFVDALMQERSLNIDEQKKMQREVLKLKMQRTKLSRMIAQMISEMSHSFTISGFFDDEEDFFEAGIKELLKEPEFNKKEENIKSLVQTLENIDKNISKFAKDKTENKDVELYIGDENKFLSAKDCSLIVAKYQLPGGEKGFIALLGPKRMKYAKNLSLLEYLVKLLSGTLVIFLILTI